MKKIPSIWFVVVSLTLTIAIGTIACSDAKAPANSSGPASSAAAKPAAPVAQSGAVGAPPAGPEVANVTEIFPAGQGRDVVLNSCASCHNLACSAIGQRTSARWDSLRESHKDKVSDADAATAFTYLKSNFNDGKPEPKVPPKFLQGGCTPF